MKFIKSLFLMALLCSIVSLAGCEKEDKAAELKAQFVILKREALKVEELLATITDHASAKKVVDQITEHNRAMYAAGFEIEKRENIQTRSANIIKKQIADFRAERKARFPSELRRLRKIKGVEDILLPAISPERHAAELPNPPGLEGN